MNESLPTASDLEKLPLRAVAAYSARSARRNSTEFRNAISDDRVDDFVDDLLDRIDAVWKSSNLEDANLQRILNAVSDLYEACSAVPDQSAIGFISIGISRAASVAIDLVRATSDPSRIEHYLQHAVEQAEKSVAVVEMLPHENAAAIIAACHDYNVLLNSCGVHEQATIGDPLDCF